MLLSCNSAAFLPSKSALSERAFRLKALLKVQDDKSCVSNIKKRIFMRSPFLISKSREEGVTASILSSIFFEVPVGQVDGILHD